MKVADNGLLYQHPSTQIPIRLATPYKVTATNEASGAVGANLATATKYQYCFVAVDATGKTEGSHAVDADSGEVTTGATAYPITVAGHGVYGGVTYEVYRRTYSGSWGSWGRMTTGLTHTTADGTTTVSYTDDGNTAPDTLNTPPASNTTAYTLPTSRKVDWISARRSGDNVLYFVNGAGICWTDGTTAGMVQPATETIGGDVLTSNRLWDVTNALYTCRGLHYHHRYFFAADAESTPQSFYWSDVDDPTYFDPDARINVPDPAGGRVLDFITKDDALVVGLTTSLYALWGKSFALTGPSATENYFSRISEVGVASEWSMRNGPGGTVLYHGADKEPHFLSRISPVKEQVVEGKLVQSVSTTLKQLSDHANAYAIFDGTQYMLAFPTDKQILRVYFLDMPNGEQLRAPVMDTMADGMVFLLKRLDGAVLGADDTTGQLWEMYKAGQYTDNGTAVEWKIKTGSFGCGLDQFEKKFRRLFVVYKAGESYTVTMNVYVDDEQSSSLTLSASGDAVYDTGTYDSAIYSREGAKTAEFKVGKKGHYARIEFTNSETDERPTLYGFRFEHTPKRRPEGE
jgi:hypothetical protein